MDACRGCRAATRVRAWSALSITLALFACQGPARIVVCDQAADRIAILDAGIPWSDPTALVWEWRARTAPGLDEKERAWFKFPTDARPVRGGEFLLITASGGGVALLRTATGELLFHAYAGGNPHSAEMLPDGAIVSASSSGNVIKLWRREAPQAPAQTVEFQDVHGLYWDPQRQRLWALGAVELINLSYAGGDAATPLHIDQRYRLPQPAGHDLGRDAEGNFVLSTYGAVWRFDPADATFQPYPGIASMADVKSISEPESRSGLPILYVHADDNWWSNTVHSTRPGWSRTLPGSRIYKARWLPGAAAREPGIEAGTEQEFTVPESQP